MKDTPSARTAALDLGDRKHVICGLDAKDEILNEESITSTRGNLAALSQGHPGALMVMEVGMQSPWIIRLTLKSLGIKLRSPNTACFARYARKALET